MKTCGKCELELPLDSFSFKNKEKGKLQSYCKKCNSAYHVEHYENNREDYVAKAKIWTKDYKSRAFSLLKEVAKNGCIQCPEKDFRCLDFDHINMEEKSFSISEMVTNKMSLEALKAELKKCQVLCSNCHRKKTAEDFHWYH